MGDAAGSEMIVIYNEIQDSLVKCGQRMNIELQTFKLIETAIESTKSKSIYLVDTEFKSMQDMTFQNIKDILDDLEKEHPRLKNLIEDETNDDNINYDGKKFRDIKINCENEVERFEMKHK